jgi:hypothetical protein
VCNDVHVMTFVHSRTNEVVDVPLDEYLARSKFWRNDQKLFQPDAPLDFTSRTTPPVDPYFLGVWYGDGTKWCEIPGRLRTVAVTKPDPEVRAICEEVALAWGLRVTRTTNTGGCPTWHIVSAASGVNNPLLDAMRALVGDASTVPDDLTRGSVEVRRQFLAGILDTDGSADRTGIEITQKRRGVIDAVVFVVRSLGLYATEPRRKVVNGETYWRINLAGEGIRDLPMRIRRKIPVGRHPDARSPLRFGFKVEPIGVGPYAGFTLDGDGRFLLADFTVTHNSSQISIGRTLWMLGRNPNMRGVVITKTAQLAQKLVRACKEYLERSPDLREVFPGLLPNKDPGMPWTSTMLTVQRSVFAKDASLQATGLFGNVMGSRYDWVVFDDILDNENTRTKTPRDHAWDWIRATVFGRLSEDAQIAFLGNAWHPEDAMHRMEKEPRFVGFRYPVRDAEGALTWPEHWNERRVERARQDMGALEFSRALLCQARDDETSRFKRDWLDACCARGEGLELLHDRDAFFTATIEGRIPGFTLTAEQARDAQIAEAARRLAGPTAAPDPLAALGVAFYTGVDLAVQQHSAADLTSLFSIAVLPAGDRLVLSVESGRWTAPDILKKIVHHHVRYESLCVVENVAAQEYLLQLLRAHTPVPVRGFTTGKQKASPEFGVESLAAEFEAVKWIIPSGKGGKQRAREVDAWILELVNYEPPPAHTGDRVMASWFAREGARPSERARLQSVGVRVFG